MPKAKYKKRADGRYLAQIPTGEYDENGKPKLKNIYARTQADLDLKIGEFRKQATTGIIVDDQGLTVKAWAEQWLKAYKSGLEHKTQKMYEGAINNHIVPYMGPMKIRDVRQHHIREFINSKSTEIDKEGNLIYGKRTLEIIVLTIKQIFEQAVDNHIIGANPATKIKLQSKVAKPKKEKRSLTTQEEINFLKLVETHDHGLFFKMLYYTGMRPEEARALTITDIDFKKDEIIIEKAAIFADGKPILKGCKTESSIRRIPLPTPLKESLQGLVPSDSLLLFPGGFGGLMSETEYRNIYESFDIELNVLSGGKDGIRAIDKFTPYMLRHNYATMMAEAGISTRYLMRLMGHSSVDVTIKYYVHVSEREKLRADNVIKQWELAEQSNTVKYSQKNKSVSIQSVSDFHK